MQLIDETQKEIREEQKQYLKGKSFKYKFQYFVEYYLKIVIGVCLVMAFIISIIVTVVSAKDNAVQVIFVNATHVPDTEAFAEENAIDTSKYDVTFDNNYYIDISAADEDSYIYLQKIVAIVASKDGDGLVGDYDTLYYLAGNEFYGDLRDYFTEEELDALGDKVIWYDYKDDDGNPTGVSAPILIDVSDSQLLKDSDSYPEGTRIVYGIITNTPRPEMAKKFYEYLYE